MLKEIKKAKCPKCETRWLNFYKESLRYSCSNCGFRVELPEDNIELCFCHGEDWAAPRTPYLLISFDVTTGNKEKYCPSCEETYRFGDFRV